MRAPKSTVELTTTKRAGVARGFSPGVVYSGGPDECDHSANEPKSTEAQKPETLKFAVTSTFHGEERNSGSS